MNLSDRELRQIEIMALKTQCRSGEECEVTKTLAQKAREELRRRKAMRLFVS